MPSVRPEPAALSLLARLVLKEVDAELLEVLRAPDLVEALDQAVPGTRAFLAREFGPEEFDDCAADFATLFLLPGGATPYAASYFEGDAGAARAQLANRVAEALDVLQIEPRDFGLGNVPMDHAGMLLALWAVAIDRATGTTLPERVQALLEPWLGTFAQAIVKTAKTPIYQATGEVLATLASPPAPP